MLQDPSRCYTVKQIAVRWQVSTAKVRRVFEREPGVLDLGTEEELHKRKRSLLRIPEKVLIRVETRMTTVLERL